MTRLLKGPFALAAVLVLFSAPMAAQVTAPVITQESATQQTGSEQVSMLQRSRVGEIGRVEKSPDRPDTLLFVSDRSAVSARNALLRGLEFGSVRYLGLSPPVDEAEADEAGADEAQEASPSVDAWGVAKNFPLAVGNIELQNVITWTRVLGQYHRCDHRRLARKFA